MRAVYATNFVFSEGTDANEVVDTAGRWFARGAAPPEVRTSWTPGRRTYQLPGAGHALEIEVLSSEAGLLWHGAWRHPHADDPDLHLVSDVEVASTDDHVSLSLVIRAMWARDKIAPPRFDMRSPRLARMMLERFNVSDAQHILGTEPTVLDAAGVPAFIDSLLLNRSRTRPVVFVADDPRHMAPNVDPDELARELAGLAHVYTSLYGRPAWELNRRLGDLGCAPGGVRIWWPGLTSNSDPYRHPRFSAQALRNSSGLSPVARIFRQISAAAAVNGLPPSHVRLRREARLTKAAQTTDAGARELYEFALQENDELTADLAAARSNLELVTDSRDMLELERDDLADKLRQAEQERDHLHRIYGDALAATTVSSDDEAHSDDDLDEPEFKTVRAAVDAAVRRCPHLEFADRAFESADGSPFENPEAILDALVKLERLAALWARADGIGGMDLAQMAASLGLDWKVDVSGTAKGRFSRLYEYTWDGRKLTMGPHVRLGSGSGAGKIARIYLNKHEPEDPTQRRLIVAHVGRKLPDKTT